MNGLTHLDANGNAVMVDVGSKVVTERVAVAKGEIHVGEAAYAAIENGTSKKGDVLGVARIAGIMAAKKTSDLIPLCHPLLLNSSSIEFTLLPETRTVEAQCTVKVSGKTGVEMEALTGVSAALLTIYDMCKAIDRGMVLGNIRLMHKEGGKTGIYDRESSPDAGGPHA